MASSSSSERGPKFTAIVPNYNDGARIAAALESLRAFDEIIVVDDGSTDDSVRVIEALLERMPTGRLIRNPRNLGVVEALNVGLRAATGTHVFLASANDTYDPRIVGWARDLLARWPDAPLLCGNSDVDVSLPQERAYFSPDELVELARTRPLRFAGGACFLAREAVLAVGGLEPSLRWNSDWFVYYLLALDRGCCVIPERMATLDHARGSYSRGIERWSEHRGVTLAFLELVRGRHARLLPRFRAAAVLPKYGLLELGLFAANPRLRWYLTPRLIHRCLEHSRLLGPFRRR
jgi:glycosyltransferase involved in cell wall biosynthesis